MRTHEHGQPAAVRELRWHLQLESMRATIRRAAAGGMPVRAIADEMGVKHGALQTFLQGRHLYPEDDEPYVRWCKDKPGLPVHAEQVALAMLAMDCLQSIRPYVRAGLARWMREIYLKRGDRIPAWIEEELAVWARVGRMAAPQFSDRLPDETDAQRLIARQPSTSNQTRVTSGEQRRRRRERAALRDLISTGGALGSGL